MTSNKQDGTMELDVNQIDLLDLPLGKSPEESGPSEPSKGPPPLPPSAAPPEPGPDLALKVPSLPPPPEAKPGVVSARNLVATSADERSPIRGFLIGLGAAGLVCLVLGIFVMRWLHKSRAAVAPTPAASVAPTSTHAFTMAPIEFTAAGSAAPQAPASVSAAASSAPHPEPSAQPTSHASGQPSTRPSSHPTPSARAPGDGILKVEN